MWEGGEPSLGRRVSVALKRKEEKGRSSLVGADDVHRPLGPHSVCLIVCVLLHEKEKHVHLV